MDALGSGVVCNAQGWLRANTKYSGLRPAESVAPDYTLTVIITMSLLPLNSGILSLSAPPEKGRQETKAHGCLQRKGANHGCT
jgi:hypothetical protein